MAKDDNINSRSKWMISLWSAVLFILISMPFTYMATNMVGKLVGVQLASGNGCPTILGLFVHTIVFLLIVRAMMEISLPGV